MPVVCELCGRPLHRGKSGNYASCVVCPIRICTTCEKYGFCPTHYHALSPRGQIILKRAFYASLIVFPACFFLLFFLGLYLTFPPVEIFPPFFMFPWIMGDFALLFGLVAVDKVWMRSFWKRNTMSLTPLPASWHCEACGFQNPTGTQHCGQCGRNKSASLRIA